MSQQIPDLNLMKALKHTMTGETMPHVMEPEILRMIGMATVVNDTYPALSRCWHDLNRIFGASFDDEDFVHAHCLLDFPCHQGKSYADLFCEEHESDEAFFRLKSFAEAMSKSRLCAYQAILSNQKTIKLKELITDKVVEVHNTHLRCSITVIALTAIDYATSFNFTLPDINLASATALPMLSNFSEGNIDLISRSFVN